MNSLRTILSLPGFDATMYIEPTQTFSEIVALLHGEIKRGTVDKKHPFRYAVLGTANRKPSLRYVVLRQVVNTFDLVFYTDLRSKKIEEMNTQNQVEVLFYHPRKQCQIRISGEVAVHSQDEVAAAHWKKVQGKGQLSYNTELAPGSTISEQNLGNLYRSPATDADFAVVQIYAKELDVLQLGENHLRMRLSDISGASWDGEWLVP